MIEILINLQIIKEMIVTSAEEPTRLASKNLFTIYLTKLMPLLLMGQIMKNLILLELLLFIN